MFSLSKEAWATIGNLLKYVLVIVVLVGGGYLLGKTVTEKDHATELVNAQRDHAKVKEALDQKIYALENQEQKVVYEIKTVYVEKQKDVDQETNDTLDAVSDGTLRLSVQIRDLEARAATAEIASATAGRFHARRAELHEKTARDLIRLTGDANTTAVRLGECQAYLKEVGYVVERYNTTLLEFYKQYGYTF